MAEATLRRLRPRLKTHFETIVVVVMSLTAVLTAWSGFQSTEWLVVQAEAYSNATNDQTESVRASNEARQANALDLQVFLFWLEATTDGDDARADFIYDGFPERLQVATDAWLGEDPFENPDAPRSPFEMEEYVVPTAEVSNELAQSGEEHTLAAQSAARRATDYVLTTVLFATVLFFASISSKLNAESSRWTLLSVAVIGLLAGVVILIALPKAL